MNKTLTTLTLALVVCLPALAGNQGNLQSDPAYLHIDKVLDLKVIHPKVNVNLPRFLLQDVTSDLNGGPDDPLAGTGIKLADLLKDVKLIRVVVIEANKKDRAAVNKAVRKLRATLDSKWIPIVTLPEGKVGIYALGDASGKSMAGMAVLVHNDENVVVANVVGRVSIGKLIKIASRMHGFPKGLLKKLAAAQGGQRNTEPANHGKQAGSSTPSTGSKTTGKASKTAPEKPSGK